MRLKENRHVVNARSRATDDLGMSPEIIPNTVMRVASQQQCFPQERDGQLSGALSPAVDAVIGLPVAEAMKRCFKSGLFYGFIGGVATTFLVLHEFAMIVHALR